MKDSGNPVEEKIEYLNPLFNPIELPVTSIEDDKLIVHNLSIIDGGIELNIVQATMLMTQLRAFIVDYYRPKRDLPTKDEFLNAIDHVYYKNDKPYGKDPEIFNTEILKFKEGTL